MAERRPRDPHEVLGIRQDASSAEISRAYRRLARELHPDSRPVGPDAADQFRAAAAAYELLSDRARRAGDNRADAQDQPNRRRAAQARSAGPSYHAASMFTSSALAPVRPGPVRIEPLPGSVPAAGEDVTALLAELLELIRTQARDSRYRTW